MSETLHLEGDLYIETFTNNVSNGVIGPVDVNSLEVKPDSEKISIPSKRKHKLGQARESYFVPKPATVNIKTSEIPPVLLAAAFMGLESPINQGGGDADRGAGDPAGAPQVGEPGQNQPLGHRPGGDGRGHAAGARYRLRDQLCPGAAAGHQDRRGGRRWARDRQRQL
ncbi:hypothetical protein [Aeromonas caviae]|uniref:hypothetical protein n=1 Tax=Aeromonas caviae TaxID=648 RepID=UPI0024422A7F|nr:hypothetical protein [Aeromonas caviae]